MSEVLTLQITIFLLVAVGFFLKKRNLVSQESRKCITDLVINVILPCNIIKAFCIDFSGQIGAELLTVLFLSVLVQIIAVFYAKIAFFFESGSRKKCLQYAILCSNSGFLGNPVAEGLYGTYGLLLASIFLIPLRIMMWTEGIAIFSGSADRKSAMKKAAKHPCIIATVIGIFLMISGLRFPEPVAKTVSYLSACNTGLSMLVVGMILGDMHLKALLDKTIWIYCFHRLLLLPGILFLVASILHVSSVVRGVVVVLTAMPAGVTTSILAAKYDRDPEFATKLVISSTLLSLPSMAIWSMILM